MKASGRATLLAILGIGLFVFLGAIQLRAVLHHETVAGLQAARLGQPPVPLPADPGPRRDYAFLPVVAHGVFRHDLEIVLKAAVRDGVLGGAVVTPLLLADGGAILVERGWVPADRRDPATRPEGLTEGAVAVTGALMPPGRRGVFGPRNDPAGDVWFHVDPEAMAVGLGLAGVRPYYLLAAPDPDFAGWPGGGRPEPEGKGLALMFAVGWFALAGVALLFYVAHIRSGRRSEPK